MSAILRSFPLNLPGASACKEFFEPTKRGTLLAAMDAQGTTPPSVTLSGTLDQSLNVEIWIDTTGGARGTAAGHWRVKGGSWTAFTTAATVALTGTGLTANFANSTYDVGLTNKYRSVMSTLAGALGTILDGGSASPSVRPYIGEINGRPTLRTDGIARRFFTTTSTLSTALVGGEDTPFTCGFAGRYNGTLAPSNVAIIWSLCDGSPNGQGNFYFGVSSAGLWACGKRGDTLGTTICAGTAADNNPHRFIVAHAGTTVTLYVDGVAVTGINGASQNVTSVTARYMMFGSYSTQGLAGFNDVYGDADFGECFAHTGALGATPIANLDQYLKNAYAL